MLCTCDYAGKQKPFEVTADAYKKEQQSETSRGTSEKKVTRMRNGGNGQNGFHTQMCICT